MIAGWTWCATSTTSSPWPKLVTTGGPPCGSASPSRPCPRASSGSRSTWAAGSSTATREESGSPRPGWRCCREPGRSWRHAPSCEATAQVAAQAEPDVDVDPSRPGCAGAGRDRCRTPALPRRPSRLGQHPGRREGGQWTARSGGGPPPGGHRRHRCRTRGPGGPDPAGRAGRPPGRLAGPGRAASRRPPGRDLRALAAAGHVRPAGRRSPPGRPLRTRPSRWRPSPRSARWRRPVRRSASSRTPSRAPGWWRGRCVTTCSPSACAWSYLPRTRAVTAATTSSSPTPSDEALAS